MSERAGPGGNARTTMADERGRRAPVTGRPDRPPVRARSGRRPIPPLIFLLVLAVAAGLVWWNVLRHDQPDARNAACASATSAPPSLNPATVHLRVLNATSTDGLATKVAHSLQGRGFVIDAIGNDSSGRTITGVGEVRHGPRGKDAAAFTEAFLPGATDYPDTRATAQVDVVIGPKFQTLASPEKVAAALSGGSASPSC